MQRVTAWRLGFVALAGFCAAALSQTRLPSLVATIPVGGATRWDLLTVDSAAQRLYVSHATQTEVIDLKENKVAAVISNTPRVHGIALVPELHRGFISDGGDSSVTVFDLMTDRVIKKIPVQGKNPQATSKRRPDHAP